MSTSTRSVMLPSSDSHKISTVLQPPRGWAAPHKSDWLTNSLLAEQIATKYEASLGVSPRAVQAPPTVQQSGLILIDISRPWLKIHRNLTEYTLHILRSSSTDLVSKFAASAKQWAAWDIITSLANYHFVVQVQLGFIKNVMELDHDTVARQISEKLAQDVYEVSSQMVLALRDSNVRESFLGHRGRLAQQLLDLVQDILDYRTCDSRSRSLLSQALMKLARACELQPICFALSVDTVGEHIGGGSFADVYRGLVGDQTVSIKAMRIFRKSDVKKALKAFGYEAVIWRQLCHPNVLPFFGIYDLQGRLCLVSPWMENGDLVEFLKNNPWQDIDHPSLIFDVASGLEYLHGEHVVHGDLKGTNILVTPSGRACIADFGLSTITGSMVACFSASTTTSVQRGTARWQAPELLRGDSVNNFGSDMYAFASVCYEILSGKIPLHDVSEPAVIFKVLEGIRPARPVPWPDNEAYNHIWELLQQIVEQLTHAPIGAEHSQPGMDWDDSYSSRFRRSLLKSPLLPSINEIKRKMFFAYEPISGRSTSGTPVFSRPGRAIANTGEKGNGWTGTPSGAELSSLVPVPTPCGTTVRSTQLNLPLAYRPFHSSSTYISSSSKRKHERAETPDEGDPVYSEWRRIDRGDLRFFEAAVFARKVPELKLRKPARRSTTRPAGLQA
ncbi:kinase-like domain-containing protein [Mycena crocata]|nr:kinase-like domain-containing protein [Mycena crocata]